MENREETKPENLEEAKPEFTAENPDPNSNHEWFAQFDPTSPEYHGGGDTRPVELTTVKQIPESMPTEHKPGQTQSEALAEVDPTNFDPVCIEIQAGYKFCGDLKKKITAFSNLITNRPQAFAKLCVEEQKKTPVVTPEITAAKEVLNEWYTEGQANSHVDDMSVMMNEYYLELDNLGNDIENIKKYNIVFTKTTRAVFKVQQTTLAKLKARKKTLKDEMAAKEQEAL